MCLKSTCSCFNLFTWRNTSLSTDRHFLLDIINTSSMNLQYATKMWFLSISMMYSDVTNDWLLKEYVKMLDLITGTRPSMKLTTAHQGWAAHHNKYIKRKGGPARSPHNDKHSQNGLTRHWIWSLSLCNNCYVPSPSLPIREVILLVIWVTFNDFFQ